MRETGTDPATKIERPRDELFTAEESACDGNAVGDVLSDNDKTEDGGDSDGCCEGEEAKESRDEGGEPDSVDGTVRVGVHAVEVTRERKSPIPREREDLT